MGLGYKRSHGDPTYDNAKIIKDGAQRLAAARGRVWEGAGPRPPPRSSRFIVGAKAPTISRERLCPSQVAGFRVN